MNRELTCRVAASFNKRMQSDLRKLRLLRPLMRALAHSNERKIRYSYI